MSNSIYKLWSRWADASPDAIAIEDDSRNITYKELKDIVTESAYKLKNKELTPGSIVIIVGSASIEFIIGMLACLALGLPFILLKAKDINENSIKILQNIDFKILITDNNNILDIISTALLDKKDLCFVNSQLSCELDYVNDFIPEEIAPDTPSYLYFTSGSTGSPKAVVGMYKSIIHFILWEINTFSLDNSVRSSQFVSPVFDAFLRDVLVPLCCGGTLCLLNDHNILLVPSLLKKWIINKRITLIHTVPSIIRLLTTEGVSAEMYRSLKYLFLSGEVLFFNDIKPWVDSLGVNLNIINLYGATETTMTKTYHIVSLADAENDIIPIGRAMPEAELMILNDDMQAVPIGSKGKIFIHTPYRSLGYYKNPEATNAVFLPNPFSKDKNDLIYDTQDIGWQDSNKQYHFVGRNNSIVKINGVRIEINTLEGIIKKVTGIAQLTVIVSSSSNSEPVLVVFAIQENLLSLEELNKSLSSKIPVGALPKYIKQLENFPLTPTGKIDREVLREEANKLIREIKENICTDYTEYEQKILKLWQEVLGPVTITSSNNSFISLGGHSLALVKLAHLFWEYFHIEVKFVDLMRNSTLAKQAKLLEEHLILTKKE